KFDGLEVKASSNGCPLVPGTVGWMDCRVESMLDVGDRIVFVAEVAEGQVTHFAPPLTAKRLVELAPTPRLAEMQRLRQIDSFVDAQAILAWRQREGVEGMGALGKTRRSTPHQSG